MKKLKMTMVTALTMVAVMLHAADPAGVSANATNRLEITGMHCDGCAKGLVAEFKSTPGVVTAEVTFSNQLAVVAFDTNRVTTAKLVKVAKEAGYQAKPSQP